MNQYSQNTIGRFVQSLLFVVLSVLSISRAQETTTIRGSVALPEKVADGINLEGLSLSDAIVLLEGSCRHPNMPYPEDWSEKTREERSAWTKAFRLSPEYQDYTAKVKAERAKRAVFSTELAEDGSFVFKDIPLAWYQLSVAIMHPEVEGEPSRELARAYKMTQFFVKDATKPHTISPWVLEVKNVLMPGDEAPDFLITDYEGKEFTLSSLRGQFVLIDFWATWCGPCIAEIPNLEEAFEKFGGDRYTSLGLSVDDKLSDPKAFLNKNPSQYLQGYVGYPERYQKIQNHYGIQTIPSIWLIDPNGKIVARDLRGAKIGEEVSKALSKE